MCCLAQSSTTLDKHYLIYYEQRLLTNYCHLCMCVCVFVSVCVCVCVCVCMMGCSPMGYVISCSVKGSCMAQEGALLIVVFMSPPLRALADLIS